METAEHGDPSATKNQAKAKAGGNGSSVFGRQRNKENCLKWWLPDMAQPGGKNGSGEEERESCTPLLLRQRIQEVPEK